MAKLRVSQKEILSDAIDFMTDQLWSSVEKARAAGKEGFIPLLRYTDEEKYANYLRAYETWPKLQGASPEERSAFLYDLGVSGEKYAKGSNNHAFEQDQNYIFFFPVRSKELLRLCLLSIWESKKDDPEGANKNFFAGTFMLDPEIAKKYINPKDKASGMGGGDYTVGNQLVHLEELALNTQDYDPMMINPSSVIEDVYLRASYIASSRGIAIEAIDDLREIAEEDSIPDLRDFCDYIAAGHGVDLTSDKVVTTGKPVLDFKALAKKYGHELIDVSSMEGVAKDFPKSTKEDREAAMAFYEAMGQKACFEEILEIVSALESPKPVSAHITEMPPIDDSLEEGMGGDSPVESLHFDASSNPQAPLPNAVTEDSIAAPLTESSNAPSQDDSPKQ